MDDLVRWLSAQLDEDERIAHACSDAPWEIEIPPAVHVSVKARRDNKWKWGRLGYVATVERDEDRAHIAEWDPARVLREIDAKRRRLDRHQPEERFLAPLHGEHEMFRVCVACTRSRTFESVTGAVLFPCPDLRYDASVYADRPGYREEWRP